MTIQKIYLLRHGELIKKYHQKYVGHLDIPLSETGKKQAQNINSFISKLTNPKIITSDLQRTFSELNLPSERKKELREINFGKWDGLFWDEIEQTFPEESKLFLKNPSTFTFPSGESYHKLSARVIPQFDSFLNEPNENIVFVVHAGVIRTIISKKFKIRLQEIFNFRIDYGKCTVIEKINNHFTLLSLNEDICSLR
jgi:broad specificity phosphatase PhoE